MRDDVSNEIERRVERGCDLYDRGCAKEAFADFLWCAERGDLGSAYRLGWMYSHGKGTSQNMTEAIRWYERAAVARPSAAYNLGMIYRRRSVGEGPESRLARRWFRRAAMLGEPNGWARYGEMYLDIGVFQRNDKRALALFRKGATEGSAHAAYRLGLAYRDGRGVRPSLHDTVRWLKVAAESGDIPSARELGTVMANNPEHFAPEDAVHWLEVSARRGDALAQHNLALIFFDGRGVEKDLQAARYWFWRAAKNDDGTAQFNLAIMLKDGTGGDRNMEKAWFWARLASSNGEEGARELVQDWRDQLDLDEMARVESRVLAWIERRNQRHNGSAP